MKPIQLLIVDDHSLFRRGLKALLSQDGRFEVSGEASDMGEALRSTRQVLPDIILLDNHLPGVRGIDGISALKETAPESHILMLTVSESEADLTAALHAGADGYLLKTVESHQLCDAIIKVLAGESVISPEMMTKFVSAFRAKNLTGATELESHRSDHTESLENSLSAREREVLALIARGDSNKAIARNLDIAETTVKVHVQHILQKLKLTSRVQAAIYAASRNLT